jgi:hypothetical protein
MKRFTIMLLAILALRPANRGAEAHTIVQQSGTFCYNTNPCALNLKSKVTAGDILVLNVGSSGSNGLADLAITDTCGSTWRRDDGSSSPQQFTFSTTAACTGAETVTSHSAGTAVSDKTMLLYEVSGLTQTIDAGARNPASNTATSSANPRCSNITTTNANDLVFCQVAGLGASTVITAGPANLADRSTWIESTADQGLATNSDLNLTSTETETSAGSYGAQYTIRDSQPWIAVTIAYKDQIAAAPTPTATAAAPTR